MLWRPPSLILVTIAALLPLMADAQTALGNHDCAGVVSTIHGTAASETINGTPGDDVIQALAGDDTINGLGGNDRLCGDQGNDTIKGGDGSDVLYGGSENDALDGGSGGSDLALYFGASNPITANLTTGAATGDGTDSLTAIEGLEGSPFGDALVGDAGANYFFGRAGNDSIDGSGGSDTVIFFAPASPIQASLTTGAATGDGSDTLTSIESLVGSDFNDNLVGNAIGNFLDGGPGSDVIAGGPGSDELHGGPGNDSLNGGAGIDGVDGGADTDTCAQTTDTLVDCESAIALPAIITESQASFRVTVESTSTSCEGDLGIASPTDQVLIGTYRSHVGESVEIGPFDAGTEIIFYISPQPFCSGTFLSTDPTHARVSTVGTNAWLIEWEDWVDSDFNDLVVLVERGAAPSDPLLLAWPFAQMSHSQPTWHNHDTSGPCLTEHNEEVAMFGRHMSFSCGFGTDEGDHGVHLPSFPCCAEDFYAQDWNYAGGNSDLGMKLLSATDGVVAEIDNACVTPYGKFVVVKFTRSGHDFFIKYTHLGTISMGLISGSLVSAGLELGTVGNTVAGCKVGASHLHVAVYTLASASTQSHSQAFRFCLDVACQGQSDSDGVGDLAEGQCGDGNDNDANGLVNDGCPQVGATAETGAQCANAIDDDTDAWINDGCPGSSETLACGANSLNPASMPERIDTTWDDDGDTQINEGLPPGAEAYDCDGDGFVGSVEANIFFTAGGNGDRDPCGNNGWPADLTGDNKLDIADINSFIHPIGVHVDSHGAWQYFNHHTTDNPAWNVQRWDLVPDGVIDIADMNALNPVVLNPTARPPMFGGLPAFFTNGGVCPWPA